MKSTPITDTFALFSLKVLLFCFIVPREFAFFIGELQLTPYRLVLIIVSFPLLWLYLTNSTKRLFFFDACALATFIWPLFAYSVTSGLETSLESGGVLFLETAVPYFLCRYAISNYRQLKSLAVTLFISIGILALVSPVEMLTGHYFIHDLSASITGNVFDLDASQRLGLWRAMGPMSHPIVLGFFCASGIALSFTMAQRERRFYIAFVLCLVGTLVSLSSAPILAAVAQFGLIAWSRFFTGHQHKWLLLALLAILLYVLIDIYSNRDPFRVMFSYLLFNSGTGYARYYMWIYATEVANHDWLSMLVGYGNSDIWASYIENSYWSWALQHSLDSYWLVQLIHFGWPYLILHMLFLISLFRQYWQSQQSTKRTKNRRILEAWMFSAAAMTLVACTVDFWGQSASLYYIILAVMGCKIERKRLRRKRPSDYLDPEAKHRYPLTTVDKPTVTTARLKLYS